LQVFEVSIPVLKPFEQNYFLSIEIHEHFCFLLLCFDSLFDIMRCSYFVDDFSAREISAGILSTLEIFKTLLQDICKEMNLSKVASIGIFF